MSDLQIVLIALGVLIIASVVFYNWWQEKKLRTNIAEEFILPQKDVLIDEFYIDTDELLDRELAGVSQKNKILEKLNDRTQSATAPSAIQSAKHVQASDEKIIPALAEASQRSEPFIELSQLDQLHINQDQGKPNQTALSPADPDQVNSDLANLSQENLSPANLSPTNLSQAAQNQALIPDELTSKPSPLPSEIHPQIDLTAFLFASGSINLQALNAKASSIISEMNVPIMIHALDKNERWHLVGQLPVDGAFKQFACSMQMADRSGPAPKSTLNKFQFSVEHLGLEFNAHVEWQGTGDAIQRAVELDKFCIEVDQLVSVHLLFDETPAHGTKFKGLAEANGLQLSSQGHFCFFANGITDHPQFVLFNKDHQLFTAESLRSNVVKGATFQLEIPKVTNCEQVFNQMINAAQKMATTLNARMVDDNQKGLGDLQIEKIRQQLKIIHARMVARGIMPGSASSMRLFN